MVIYCFKYGIVAMKEHVFHLCVLFLRTKYVIFLYVVHMSNLYSYLYYFNCVLHIPLSMSCVYYAMFICGCICVVFYCAYNTLNCVLNERPVWPIYCRGPSLHLSIYTIIIVLIIIALLYFLVFCMVFVFLFAIFMLVSLKMLATFLVSFQKYVSVTHWPCFWCWLCCSVVLPLFVLGSCLFGIGSVVKCVLVCLFLCLFQLFYRVCVKYINLVVNCWHLVLYGVTYGVMYYCVCCCCFSVDTVY
jgi:hypothetical protein